MAHEHITLTTSDDFHIEADFYNSNSSKSLILLHQLSMTKQSWKAFSQKALAKNYNVIAIDLRGHGQSQGLYQEMTDEDFPKSVNDVKAAKNYLQLVHSDSKISIIGASIGANLAAKFSNEDDIVLLSPGLNYRGITTENDIKNAKKRVLIIVAKGDTYSYSSSLKLKQLNPNVELKVLDGSEHGVKMLTPEIEEEIFKWLG